MIEVILLERVERLGQLGQVVKVRPGFARNFLLPQNKALRATKVNLEQFEKQRAELEARNITDRSNAEAQAKKLEGAKLVLIRQAGDTGQLYGSVSARDVADAAKEAKQPIERGQVQIDTPIKTLGLFQVKVKLHPEVLIKVTINVARSQEEALSQAEKVATEGRAAAKAAAAEALTLEAPAAEVEAPAGEEAAEGKKPAKKSKKADAAEEGEDAGETKPKKAAKAKKSAEA